MSKENQIEEMAITMVDSDNIEVTNAFSMLFVKFTEALYNAGYRKQSEWISVEERWPETDGYYLVWNKVQRKIEIRFFHRLSPYYPVETYPEIRAYFGNCSNHKSITHWMPLPEPPEMKGV